MSFQSGRAVCEFRAARKFAFLRHGIARPRRYRGRMMIDTYN